MRKPMSGRDVVVAIGVIQDKRALIRREPTRIIDNSVNALSQLAKEFDRIAQEANRGTVIDITPKITN